MENQFWREINRTQITKNKIKDLSDFKSSEVNFKIALWNPHSNGVRYLKMLLYNLADSLSSWAWEKLKKVKNREIGRPFTITYNNQKVCLDYLRAILELEFMKKHIYLDGKSILEIGAGYGRTCHTMMSNIDIKEYVIVDLENCLELSRRYLNKVLSKKSFKKIKFMTELPSQNFDLCININSFEEMAAQEIKRYLTFIDKYCKLLYVNNPVGKYLDKSLDGHFRGERIVKMALSNGLLRDIIDIHDNKQIERQSRKFIRTYRPSSRWRCIARAWAKPWSYYRQAIYKKSGLNRQGKKDVCKT